MKPLICLGVGMGFHEKTEDQIVMMRDAGFDGYFTGCHRGCDAGSWAAMGRKYGMYYQSMHAPFGRANRLWETGAEGDDTEKELCDCLDICSENGVPILVAHTFIGFEEHSPNEIGAERFARIGEYARNVGVKLALENTEGEEYLACAMEAAKGNPYVGFCLDTGHEMCYNRSQDMLALYGDRLIATHLNDNLGITGDTITWLDDSHLMPFDGVADWQNIVSRLCACNFGGEYTMELTRENKPGRHTHDRYAQLTFTQYLAEAYQRVQRIVAMMD